MINDHNMTFDVAFTSVLKRAIKTLYLIQDGCDLHWIPVHRHWRLNERMYGALQGLNKSETAAKHGEEQVKVWLLFCGVAYLIAFNTVTCSANHLCYAIFDNYLALEIDLVLLFY